MAEKKQQRVDEYRELIGLGNYMQRNACWLVEYFDPHARRWRILSWQAHYLPTTARDEINMEQEKERHMNYGPYRYRVACFVREKPLRSGQ